MLYLVVPGSCVCSLPRLLISPCHGGFLGHPDNIWHGRQILAPKKWSPHCQWRFCRMYRCSARQLYTKIPWVWCLLHQVYKKFSHYNGSRSGGKGKQIPPPPDNSIRSLFLGRNFSISPWAISAWHTKTKLDSWPSWKNFILEFPWLPNRCFVNDGRNSQIPKKNIYWDVHGT